MDIKNKNIGFCITGSFCTIPSITQYIKQLVDAEANVTPILSPSVDTFDTRFGNACDLKKTLYEITGNKVLTKITEVEPIGPKATLDVLVVSPCTGNTLAKIANAITDTSVTMAVKAHLRNERPVVLGISTNDALAANAKNIGLLLNMKNIYMIPFYQDDPINKSKSLLSKNELLLKTIEAALDGIQIQPIIMTA